MIMSLRILKNPIWRGIPGSPDVKRSSKHQHQLSQKFKNRLWKIGTLKFQKWLEVDRGTCTNDYKLEDIEESNLEVLIALDSPPIYDEYLDVEAFDRTKENIGVSSSQPFRLFMPKWR
ncbi:hypothetical protein M0R45_018868 [Rubus argutus]|uniref:Uncharacterized protein n=1 Tax=Rubus argutus TaxID=59490 RepID=A0AAW1X5I4_RUBAR